MSSTLARSTPLLLLVLSACWDPFESMDDAGIDGGEGSGSCILATDGGVAWSCISWYGAQNQPPDAACASMGVFVSTCPSAESFVGCCAVDAGGVGDFQQCFYPSILEGADGGLQTAEGACAELWSGTWEGPSPLTLEP